MEETTYYCNSIAFHLFTTKTMKKKTCDSHTVNNNTKYELSADTSNNTNESLADKQKNASEMKERVGLQRRRDTKMYIHSLFIDLVCRNFVVKTFAAAAKVPLSPYLALLGELSVKLR